MYFIALAKLLKALGLFIREMWLRDRTFRQFVHENLSLIVLSFGFTIMTFLFTHVWVTAKEQEEQIADQERLYARLQDDYDTQVPFLTERMDWYKDRYFELKVQTKTTQPSWPATRRAPRREPTQPPDKPIVHRPPSNDLAERWKKLSQ